MKYDKIGNSYKQHTKDRVHKISFHWICPLQNYFKPFKNRNTKLKNSNNNEIRQNKKQL